MTMLECELKAATFKVKEAAADAAFWQAEARKLAGELSASNTLVECLQTDCKCLTKANANLTVEFGRLASEKEAELDIARKDTARMDTLAAMRGRFMYYENHTERWLDFTDPRRVLDWWREAVAARKAAP
jgi:hypothetical protein